MLQELKRSLERCIESFPHSVKVALFAAGIGLIAFIIWKWRHLMVPALLSLDNYYRFGGWGNPITVFADANTGSRLFPALRSVRIKLPIRTVFCFCMYIKVSNARLGKWKLAIGKSACFFLFDPLF
jgi:hypothetical protein